MLHIRYESKGMENRVEKLLKKKVIDGEAFAALCERLQRGERPGVSLGGQCYKERLKSSCKGKSHGSRVHYQVYGDVVTILVIHTKTERENVRTK